MSLRNWLNNGWLVEHAASPAEIADLLEVADRDIRDSRVPGLSTDARFRCAYNAALKTAVVALAAEGYRPARDLHHYRAIQSLELTLALSADAVARFDKFRKKRNIGDYERAGYITNHEADEMLTLALELRGKIDDWLKENHPELLGG